MIMFDFICGDCKETYERLMKSDSIQECKLCGSKENQARVISPPKIAYATDSDSPKSEKDLQNYLGNGEYVPGYQR